MGFYKQQPSGINEASHGEVLWIVGLKIKLNVFTYTSDIKQFGAKYFMIDNTIHCSPKGKLFQMPIYMAYTVVA